MTTLIDSLARMTGNRDRDTLESSVIRVLTDILRPRRLRLLKVIPVGDSTRVHLRIEARENESLRVVPLPAKGDSLPLLSAHPTIVQMLARRRLVALPQPDRGVFGYFVPLSNGSEPIGWVEFEGLQPLNQDHERMLLGLLQIYCNHVAILDYSEHDTLTGLMNRRTFDDSFRKLLMTSDVHQLFAPEDGEERRGEPGEESAHWLGVVDIDHFKRINDRFGHVLGDEVLVLLARLMRASFRISDRIYRFGGEEFAILLDRTGASNVQPIFERFRELVQAHAFAQAGQLTISIGYTRIVPGDTPAGAFERSDAALYFAKQNGRNQVHGYEALRAAGRIVATTEKVDSQAELT